MLGREHETMPPECLAGPECDEWLLLVLYKHGAGPQGTHRFLRDWEEVKCRTRWKYSIPERGRKVTEERKKLWVPGGGMEAGDAPGPDPPHLRRTRFTELPRRGLIRSSEHSRADMLPLSEEREAQRH